MRQPATPASRADRTPRAGTTLRLPGDGRATLLAPYPLSGAIDAESRLWIAAVHTPEPIPQYLERRGRPIRYGYVARAWPSSSYQTVFATEPGSAEMPSAARPFTPALVTRLVSHGVQIAPMLLHTGVASLEDHEPPYEEYYRVPRETAERVNATRAAGHRVIAVGTTVVRALETVTDDSGRTSPGSGWTNLVITANSPLRSVTGLITGLHEPRATHLAMLERVVDAATRTAGSPRAGADAFCAACHLERAYVEARAAGYLWHEFGDSHLIIGAA